VNHFSLGLVQVGRVCLCECPFHEREHPEWLDHPEQLDHLELDHPDADRYECRLYRQTSGRRSATPFLGVVVGFPGCRL
jgi:hypothetical protein